MTTSLVPGRVRDHVLRGEEGYIRALNEAESSTGHEDTREEGTRDEEEEERD